MKYSNTSQTSEQHLAPRRDVLTRLREHGVSPTRQRVEIGRVLFARPQHISADQLMVMVMQAGYSVSKATIYNTLNLFVSKGLVREIIVDPERVFYDSSTAAHHHFFNVDTGELTDIPPGSLLELEDMPALPAGTALSGVDIIIRVHAAEGP